MHFQWKIKWRLEHLGELRIMGETAPLKALHFPTKDTILTWFLDGRRTSFWQAVIDMQRRHAFLSSSKDNKTEQFLPRFYQKPEKRELSWTLSLPKVNLTKPRKLLNPEPSNETKGVTTQMKALDEYFLVVAFTLLLNTVNVFANLCLIWTQKHDSERYKWHLLPATEI